MTGGLFAILDDIALLLDDAATMSKVAAKKTAGILGDDLAVNAEKATGFKASRELPVLWAITRGSFINKLILLPLAFLFSAYASWLIVPVLLVGGAYLAYEGVEKILHTITHAHDEKSHPKQKSAGIDPQTAEKAKIKSAIRTDFILSIEIVVIALGTVLHKSLMIQVMVVSLIAILATVGVYGFVALIVRMDDAGLFLMKRAEKMKGLGADILIQAGRILIASLPLVIRALGIIGTIAMLIVGGGMYTHNIETLHHIIDVIPPLPADFLVGLVLGSLLLGVELLFKSIKNRFS